MLTQEILSALTPFSSSWHRRAGLGEMSAKKKKKKVLFGLFAAVRQDPLSCLILPCTPKFHCWTYTSFVLCDFGWARLIGTRCRSMRKGCSFLRCDMTTFSSSDIREMVFPSSSDLFPGALRLSKVSMCVRDLWRVVSTPKRNSRLCKITPLETNSRVIENFVKSMLFFMYADLDTPNCEKLQCRPVRRGGAEGAIAPPSWANYFKSM